MPRASPSKNTKHPNAQLTSVISTNQHQTTELQLRVTHRHRSQLHPSSSILITCHHALPTNRFSGLPHEHSPELRPSSSDRNSSHKNLRQPCVSSGHKTPCGCVWSGWNVCQCIGERKYYPLLLALSIRRAETH
jgi:hypothetical protein